MTKKRIRELEQEVARLRGLLEYKGQKRDRREYMREYQRKRRAKLRAASPSVS